MAYKLPAAKSETALTEIEILSILGVSNKPMDPIGGVLSLG